MRRWQLPVLAFQRINLTEAGAALGTADYMPPEQLLGNALDERSYLFSFGEVLYEMATGVGPFTGNSALDIFDAILHKTPPRRER